LIVVIQLLTTMSWLYYSLVVHPFFSSS